MPRADAAAPPATARPTSRTADRRAAAVRSLARVALLLLGLVVVGAPSPAAAQLIAIGDAPPARYELLGRFRLATYPVVVGDLSSDAERLVFVTTPTWGGRIEEYGDRLINRVNTFTVATQGITNVRATTVTSGGQTYAGYSYTSAGGPRVAGRFGHWSFDLSDDVWDFDAATFWNSYLGFRLHFWALRGFEVSDLPSQRDPDGKGERLLAEVGASQIYRKRAFDIAIIPRLPLALARGRAGYATVEASLPIVYLAAGFMMALGSGYESSVYLFGAPTVTATWHLPLGPVAARAWLKVPSRFAVVPWYLDASEVGGELGVRF